MAGRKDDSQFRTGTKYLIFDEPAEVEAISMCHRS